MGIGVPRRAAPRGAAAFLCVLCACASPRDGAFERVAVIGASLSAGFELEAEAGGALDLAGVLECALTAPHAPVASAADIFFFLQPGETGARLARKAAETNPTLVVALDFLFWFAAAAADAERPARLEAGLRLLEGFACPVIVGDLPDMSEAVGRVLSPRQVPAPAVLAELNGRIRAWARGRAAVVVPLSEMIAKMRAGEEVRAGSRVYSGAEARKLLQGDRLHPTVEGLACAAVAALEAFSGAGRGAYLDDPKVVAAKARKWP